ncbi:flagellar hook-associated protein FlgK [Vulcaniibacterium tengchongense]|uniref:Flagellar hook-associated protein 1 n=1 Tax=Vulcaniibacterium tengchongense TaxID=1273429 RepID=A0A3N4VCZ8_9GAMM|nr:flagellar hook-associated protein FlgK [Vulcaniibacterium tengchongense]RPE80876.1 flagellar hook-associated protein 1 FlgK [Vulcaniibacterium tengchongense]
MANVLSTGAGALIAFQRALATVSHNVANVATDGYSRQRVELATRNPTDMGYGYVGNGVQVADVRRVADELATARLLDSGGELARLQQLAALASRVDGLLSDPATGLAGVWSNFFDAASGLGAAAASSAAREDLLADARALATRFNQLDGQLDAMDDEVDAGLRSAVAEVNRLSSEIARLNGEIVSNPGHVANDLLDQRDRLIAELAGHTGGRTVAQSDGALNVVTPGGQALVVGNTAARLTAVADPYRPDRLQLALEGNGAQVRLDAATLGGKIGGLLEFRGGVLDPALAELGRLATGLAATFNAQHRAGMDLNGQMGADFFALPAPSAYPHAGNAGDAGLQARVGDLAAVDGRNVLLRFDGSAWSATDPNTGAAVALSGTGTAADPLRVGGVEIVVGGTAAAGDRFLLQPTAGIAGGLGVAIADPNRIAAATPVKAQAELGNLGSGKVAGLRVDDAANPALLANVEIEFIDADRYTVDGAGPFAYTPGQPIAANGWSLTLDGAPAAGDRFGVGPAGAGSSDNGNALLLANLDDAKRLNGGTVSLNGALGGLTTSVGSSARQADQAAQAQQILHDQAQSARDAVAGVNIDEEAANMLRFQQAYQAAAQVIATADGMFQSLIQAVSR